MPDHTEQDEKKIVGPGWKKVCLPCRNGFVVGVGVNEAKARKNAEKVLKEMLARPDTPGPNAD